MIAYLDSSTVLRIVFRQPNALASWGDWDWALTSELTRIEGLRSIDRLRIAQRLTDEQLADHVEDLETILGHFNEIELERQIFQRASQPFATAIGTLDAIHVASALIWRDQSGKELTFLTHDSQQGVAARAIGLKTGGF